MPQQVSPTALERLRTASAALGTTALVVLEDGQPIAEAGEVERPIELMSVTKSVVSLIVGQLVDRGLLSLDQPVADFVPAWRGTPKQAIRVAHVLEHTTGLADQRTTEAIYAAGDFVAFACAADLIRPPGTRFFYSNRATNLLAAIVAQGCGEPMDAWAQEHLFGPLGISDFAWETDRAGNVQALAGLRMSARSLARLGQLVLDGGRCAGERLVSEAWLEASTRVYCKPGPSRGLLWWLEPETTEVGLSPALFETWRAAGVPEDLIARLRPLEGQYFPAGLAPGRPFLAAIQKALIGREAKLSDRHLAPYHRATWKAGLPDADVRHGPPRTISANGWGGQHLIIAPAQRLVVARLREVTGAPVVEEEPSFLSLVNEHLLGAVQTRPAQPWGQRLLYGAARQLFSLRKRWRSSPRR